MGSSEIHINKAIQEIRIADHMLTQTYEVVKDDKLLLGIANKILVCFNEILKSALDYEKEYKRIPPYHEGITAMIEKFNKCCLEIYNVDKESLNHIKDLYLIIEEHNKSPIEFSNKGEFVICSDDYKIKKITKSDLGNYINTAKQLITKTKDRIDKHERLIRRRTNIP